MTYSQTFSTTQVAQVPETTLHLSILHRVRETPSNPHLILHRVRQSRAVNEKVGSMGIDLNTIWRY